MAKPGTFTKGDARINRKGRPKKGETLAEMFRDAMSEPLDEATGYTKLHSMIDKVVTRALQGNQDALEYAMARGYGKLIERVETNNINKNYDFSNLSLDERMKLLELISRAKPTVADDNPDSL